MNRPRFAEIARELTEGIASGRFPVGSYLPTELELRDQYQTSRHTIRAALHELQQLGFVSRRKNAGTRVESAQPRNGFRPTLASVDDLVQFGSENLREVQSVEEVVADAALADVLQCDEGERWLRISSLRVERNAQPARASARTSARAVPAAPVGWTDVYIDPAYQEVADQARTEPDTLISSLIETRYGRRVAEIRQDVSALILAPDMAARLAVDAGTAALRVVRQYFDASGKSFEVSVTVHPAGRFSISMRLTRSNDIEP